MAERLVERAREDGVELIGPGGLLTGLTSKVINTALDAEMAEHLGYDKHDPAGRNGENSRNGKRTKTVLTELGPVPVEVPRDREGTFAPQIVRKRQRRLDRIDEIVLSLSARGLTTGEVSAHFADIYGSTVSKDTVSRITDLVLEEMAEWCSRPLDAVYPVMFIDALVVKIRDGQVTNRPIYVVVGITVNGERDILGLWAGDGGEGAKFWLAVLTDLKNRGVRDVCMVVCDGLKGLPDAINTTWSFAQVQTCILHLIRNTFRFASKTDWEKLSKDLRPVYTAPNAKAASLRFQEFTETWGQKYPAIITLWRQRLGGVHPLPGLRHRDPSSDLLDERDRISQRPYRRAVRARGHFPTEQAALKCLYLAAIHRQKNRPNPTGQIAGWKGILNVLSLTYGHRLGLN